MYDETQHPIVPTKSIENEYGFRKFIEATIRHRAYSVVNPIQQFFLNRGVKSFHVAGGALFKGPINDIDVWPTYGGQTELLALIPEGLDNAIYEYRGTKIQICKNPVGTLNSLISGFDFAHCRVGVTFCLLIDPKEKPSFHVESVCFDNYFIAAMASQTTFYCGALNKLHGSPLRTLRRLPKVAVKLGLTQQEVNSISVQIIDHVKTLGSAGLEIQNFKNSEVTIVEE